MVALEEAGLPADHPALVKAADWLLTKQILGAGDWQIKNKTPSRAAGRLSSATILPALAVAVADGPEIRRARGGCELGAKESAFWR